MDYRGLRVSRPTSSACSRVGGCCLTAMEELDYRSRDLHVEICDDPWVRLGVEAGAYVGGIHVSPQLLTSPARLIWVLSEEVAHRYLNEVFGVPHGGDFLDRFAQEGFASWFQCHRTLPELFSPDEIVTQPITEHEPSPRLGHDLGKHAGSARGGSYKSTARLEAWFASREGAPDFKLRVRQALDSIPADLRPADLAGAIAAAHGDARNRGC
jgi:hypothetical protein